MNFSQDQINAVNGICNKLLDPNTPTHVLTVLTGSAGTGKNEDSAKATKNNTAVP